MATSLKQLAIEFYEKNPIGIGPKYKNEYVKTVIKWYRADSKGNRTITKTLHLCWMDLMKKYIEKNYAHPLAARREADEALLAKIEANFFSI